MFVHLHCHSPFSFMDGAATIESLVAQAAMQQMPAMALTDHNTIAGLPSFHKWAAAYGIKPISGAELTLEDGTHLTVLAETRKGYEHLCRLLTVAHDGKDLRRNPVVPESLLFQYAQGLIVFSGCRRGRIPKLLLRNQKQSAKHVAEVYRAAFPDAFFLELQGDSYPQSESLNRLLAELGGSLGIPLIATSNVHHAVPDQFPVYDVLSCMRLGCDVRTPHAERPLNHSRWLHSVAEAERRFAKYPSAVANTILLAERCQVVLTLGDALFPSFPMSSEHPCRDTHAFLRHLVYQGAKERYPRVDAALRQRLEHELSIIEQLGYVDYFLVVWDIVNYARRNRIRCAGRGSAADSAVAYCLYITDVDAAGRGLLFERFMSLERAEKPDIDIDFDSRRRDEVMAYVYRKYGQEHVARVATYQTFRGRSAVREVGAALALPPAILDTIAKRIPWMAHADRLVQLFEKVPEMKELAPYQQQLTWLWQLAAQIPGFPRHFGMHVGGLVISRRPLLETTSLQPSAKGEWMTPFDKDAAEEVGLVKLDLLSLRTMSAIEGTIVLRERQGHQLDYDLIPFDDKATFEMLGTGETIGVFQLESPAQRVLQSRLQPTGLEDIVASVALIRPGPIKGNMVDPFLARRHGREPISYLHPKLEPILGKTFGVVLFQEQVIEIATAIANFTPGEADQLRRVMSHARSTQEMERIGQQFLEKASQAGVSPEVAATIFSYIQSYASYGFCEAHAAAFAATAYKTAYLVKHYPAEFYASILNQYPMGYYPIHVIVAEARRRGISVLGVDVNQSEWACTVTSSSSGPAIRIGFCLLKGFREQVANELLETRQREGDFTSVLDCLCRVHTLDRLSVERMIRVGAFDGIEPGARRRMLWELPFWMERRHANRDVWWGEDGQSSQQARGLDQDLSLATKLQDEYNYLGVGITGHWMDLFRAQLDEMGYQRVHSLKDCMDGEIVITAGLLVRPHRPPTKSGKTVVFFTLEDETDSIDSTMFESVYHASGAILFTPYGRLIGVEAEIQRRCVTVSDDVIASEGLPQVSPAPQLIVRRVWSLVETLGI